MTANAPGSPVCDRIIRSRASCCLTLPLLAFASVAERRVVLSITAEICCFYYMSMTLFCFDFLARILLTPLFALGDFTLTWYAGRPFPPGHYFLARSPFPRRPDGKWFNFLSPWCRSYHFIAYASFSRKRMSNSWRYARLCLTIEPSERLYATMRPSTLLRLARNISL